MRYSPASASLEQLSSRGRPSWTTAIHRKLSSRARAVCGRGTCFFPLQACTPQAAPNPAQKKGAPQSRSALSSKKLLLLHVDRCASSRRRIIRISRIRRIDGHRLATSAAAAATASASRDSHAYQRKHQETSVSVRAPPVLRYPAPAQGKQHQAEQRKEHWQHRYLRAPPSRRRIQRGDCGRQLCRAGSTRIRSCRRRSARHRRADIRAAVLELHRSGRPLCRVARRPHNRRQHHRSPGVDHSLVAGDQCCRLRRRNRNAQRVAGTGGIIRITGVGRQNSVLTTCQLHERVFHQALIANSRLIGCSVGAIGEIVQRRARRPSA